VINLESLKLCRSRRRFLPAGISAGNNMIGAGCGFLSEKITSKADRFQFRNPFAAAVFSAK